MSSSFPISLGPFRIEDGAFLAPMAGITNPPFRQLCRELGASLCVTELISCHAVMFVHSRLKNRRKIRGRKLLSLLEKYEGESPYVVQLYGREPDIMADAARVMADSGADIIDLNFGCPARKVVKNGAGCGVALMRDPALLARIASEVVAAVNIPVTAKIRLGYGPGEKNAVPVAQALAQSGVQLVTVHARTRDQGHKGPIDMALLAEVVDAVDIPVVGNGGIQRPEDAEEMLRQTGCARVAVGQGAKGNPWLFRHILSGDAPVPLDERIAICRRHLALYVQWIGEERAAIEMRKHACWYLKGFDGAAAFRKRLGEAVSPDIFHQLLDELVRENPPADPPGAMDEKNNS